MYTGLWPAVIVGDDLLTATLTVAVEDIDSLRADAAPGALDDVRRPL